MILSTLKVEEVFQLLLYVSVLRPIFFQHLKISFYLRLQISLIFLPEKPYVSSASLFLYASLKCFAYLAKIAVRDCRSGNINWMLKSILLSMAGSISCFLLVAHISNTSVVD